MFLQNIVMESRDLLDLNHNLNNLSMLLSDSYHIDQRIIQMVFSHILIDILQKGISIRNFCFLSNNRYQQYVTLDNY
jgi:hypothetical protein